MKNIDEVLLEHMDEAKRVLKESDRDVKILGIFLYGSQNYNFADEYSDIDTKCIVIPTARDLCLRQPISMEHVLPNEEHCVIKDVRLAVREFRKMNIEDMQLFYTNYYWINQNYNCLWYDLKSKRNQIVHGDKQSVVKSIFHQIQAKLCCLKSSPKDLANVIRLDYFLEQYMTDKPYEDCIKVPDILPDGITREKLMSIKRTSIKLVDNEYMKLVESITNKYKDAECPVKNTDEKNKAEMNAILDSFLINIVTKCITETK